MTSKVRIVDLPAFTVDSHGNGWAYEVQIGNADNLPMRTVWVQDESATDLRAQVSAIEAIEPDLEIKEVWLTALDMEGLI